MNLPHFLMHSVFVATPLSWLVLGYLIRIFFPALSMSLFLTIGLVAGLWLVSLLAFMHEDPVRSPVSLPEAPVAPPDDSLPSRTGIRPNVGGQSSLT